MPLGSSGPVELKSRAGPADRGLHLRGIRNPTANASPPCRAV